MLVGSHVPLGRPQVRGGRRWFTVGEHGWHKLGPASGHTCQRTCQTNDDEPARTTPDEAPTHNPKVAGFNPAPATTDYSANGLEAADFARNDLVTIVRDAVSGYTATQHLSPNHVIDFDVGDPDRAVCMSYMYAQHHADAPENGEFLFLGGSYTNQMVRTADGWRIERLIQYVSWREAHES